MADLEHASQLGVSVWDVRLVLSQRIDHVAERQEPHVDVDALLESCTLRFGPFLPLASFKLPQANFRTASPYLLHMHASIGSIQPTAAVQCVGYKLKQDRTPAKSTRCILAQR